MYTTLFAFGDSLSDAGNDYYIDGGTDPVSPYYEGHFSNGLTWVEDLSSMLGLGTLTPSLEGGHDFAFGGAETGPTAIEGVNPGDLLEQVAQYALKYPQYQGALYTLDIGGNDIDKALDEYRAGQISVNEVGTVVAQAEANTVEAVETLFALGARNLLFFEVPDLGLTPHFLAEGTAWQNLASGLAASFDQTVLSDLVPLERLGLKVYDLPTYSLLDTAVNNPSAFASYGVTFTNVTDPAWTGNFTSSTSGSLAADPNSYLFFDSVHPTAAAHQLTADLAYQELNLYSNTNIVEAMYIGYFGRAADPSGDSYWLSEFNSGAISEAGMAASFSVQPEATTQYPFLANPSGATVAQIDAFIGSVYQDLFDRAPDSSGLSYWQNQLESNLGNPQAVGQFIVNVISGAQSGDQTTLLNKVTVANYFTQHLGNADIPYTSSAAALAHSSVASVTSDFSTITSAEASINQWISTVGVSMHSASAHIG
jgi:phospholipase/lecithinase/hemolysin